MAKETAATTLGRRLAAWRNDLTPGEQRTLDTILAIASRATPEVAGYDEGNTGPNAEWCNAFVSEVPQRSPGINIGSGISQSQGGSSLSRQRMLDRP